MTDYREKALSYIGDASMRFNGTDTTERDVVMSRRYIRQPNNDVWGVSLKVGSTTLRKGLGPKPRNFTELEAGDHVRLLVRDPRDRMVSAFTWFNRHVNSYIKGILEVSPQDHAYLLDSTATFAEWTRTALKHWNPHWVPQTTMHPRWREFEIIDLAEWGKTQNHDKKTREDNTWEQHYDEATLALVNEVYAEDLEMWKEIKDGTDTRTNRIL